MTSASVKDCIPEVTMLKMPVDTSTEFDGIRFLANREMIEIVRHCDEPSRQTSDVTPPKLQTSPTQEKKERRRSVQFKFEEDNDLDIGQLSIRKTPLPPISSGSESSSDRHPQMQSDDSANEIIDIIERANQRKRGKSFNFLTSQQRKREKEVTKVTSPRKQEAVSPSKHSVTSPRKDSTSQVTIKSDKSTRGKLSPRKRSKSLHNTLTKTLTIIKEDSKLTPSTFKSSDVTRTRRARSTTIEAEEERADESEDEEEVAVLRMSRTMSHDRMTYRRPSERLAPVDVAHARRKSKLLANIDLDRFQATDDHLTFIKSALSTAPCPITPETVRRRSLAQQTEVAQMLAKMAEEKREEEERALVAAERRSSTLLHHPSHDASFMQEVNEVARDVKEKFPTADIVVRTARNELMPVVEKKKTYDVNWGDEEE